MIPLVSLQEMAFLRKSRQMFAQLAQFLSQASADEARSFSVRRKRNNSKSFHRDLQQLQEAGVYDIMCHIDVDLVNETFEPSRSVLDCGEELKTLATIDNRNYMILHMYKLYLEAFHSKMRQLFNR